MTRTALALSPHLDDAAFSCGGTLAVLSRTGWRVVLATLFTRSVPDPQGFALACQLDKGLGPDVDYMALRRDEDRAAAQALEVAVLEHVALMEAPHRGYDTAGALFGPVRPADDVATPLAAVIDGLIHDHAPDLILAPQAVGGHVDHVQVVRALGDTAVPTLWWRDFPYTIRADLPREPFADRFAALPLRTVELPLWAKDAKQRACAAYASQLGFQFGGRDALPAMLARAGTAEQFRVTRGDRLTL